MDTTFIYPPTPQNVDESILQPSPAFKREVLKVLGAIVLFIGVYLLLVAAAIGLAALSAMGGFLIITNVFHWTTILFGLGLIGLGIMVVYFLFKFLFHRQKVDQANFMEIREEDQPRLFEFIRTITRETNTPFPKKIFLSPEINAYVFYNSSFWSMFLPVRKNLNIGLGLVNCVNISEFKAVLAHEFGHFSQHSMRLGSYTYHVNKIIHNLLFENDGYERTLESWGSASQIFAFFANLTVAIVKGIQWVLQRVYGFVNARYLSLSRQMEFHADTVAASVSGSDHLITALRRLDVAELAYNRLFGHYNSWLKQNLKPDNLYLQHAEIMKHFAEDHGLRLENGLPQVDADSFSSFNKTRVIIKDQWASHPSTDDREMHLKSLNIRTEVVHASAWAIFQQIEPLQQQVTARLYDTVTFEKSPQTLDYTGFRERYYAEVQKYKLHSRYKGFFNFRYITSVDLHHVEDIELPYTTLDDVLDENTLSLPFVADGLKADIGTLEAIANKSLPVRTFEFQGAKYGASDAPTLLEQLKSELTEAEAKLALADKHIIAFFLQTADRHGIKEALREQYSNLFIATKTADDDNAKYIDILQALHPIYYGNIPMLTVYGIMNTVKLKEKDIKERLKMIMENADYSDYMADAERKTLENYISKEHVYFIEPNFNNEALVLLNDSLGIYQAVISDRVFAMKKKILEEQLLYEN